MQKLRPFVFIVLLTTAACGIFPAPSSVPSPVPVPDTPAPPTATPFLPVASTQTPTPTQTPTETPTVTPTMVNPWENFPEPIRDSATAIPRPIREEVGKDRVNIIVIGTDDEPGRKSMNSDVMVLVSIDTRDGTVSMVSIPRDLYVYIPGRYMNRVNAAYAWGGRDLLELTLLYNFGVRVDYYARVNFYSFKKAIDTLGGVDVEAQNTFTDYCYKWYSYVAGETYHMNGSTALCYVRMRMNSGGDFGRQKRAQEVLVAAFKKAVSLEGLLRIPELYGQYSEMVETDMELVDLLALAPTAAQLAQDPSRIEGYTMDGLTTAWTTPGGANVHLPNREEIQAMLEIAFD